MQLKLIERPAASPVTSSVVVRQGKTTVVADGVDSCEVLVVLRSQNGALVPSVNVQLGVDGQNNAVSPGEQQTDNRGEALFTIRSTRAELKTVNAFILPDDIPLEERVTPLFVAGPPAIVTLDAPATLDIGAQADIPIDVKDKYDNPVPDLALTLTTSRGKVPTEATDKGNGQYTFVYTAPQLRAAIPSWWALPPVRQVKPPWSLLIPLRRFRRCRSPHNWQSEARALR